VDKRNRLFPKDIIPQGLFSPFALGRAFLRPARGPKGFEAKIIFIDLKYQKRYNV
jgi:hypothetical protein